MVATLMSVAIQLNADLEKNKEIEVKMEIERKFLVDIKKLKENVNLQTLESKDIIQYYLSIDENNSEIRIRKTMSPNDKASCTLTIKSNGDLSREEFEFPIDATEFDNIVNKKLYVRNPIVKKRYLLKLPKDNLMEIDVYLKKLTGLVVAEIEFKTEIEAINFTPPQWISKEITFDKQYKNKNLALNDL